MEVTSLNDFNKLESQIASVFGKIKLGDVLHSLYLLSKNSPDLEPFVVAGVALLAARFCPPSKQSQPIKNCNIKYLVNLSKDYYLCDPITFDNDLYSKFINSNPDSVVLRLVYSQFPFNPQISSGFSRPIILFDEIPKQLKGTKNIPIFDFESKFKSISGVSVIDFITIGFVVASASRGNFAFTYNFFDKARKQGIQLPDDKNIRSVMDHLTADKFKLIELYEKRKNKDRRYRMYDFNPFVTYPIIRPCQSKGFSNFGLGFMHAPIPELIAPRISQGIYYQMRNAYWTDFTDYFGHVFEKYVGLILENSVSSEQILSDSDIRDFYPSSNGKAPDWILIDGSTAILVECKAFCFSRPAQAIADEDSINSSLKQVVKGLEQLSSFISACQSKSLQLQKLQHCNIFKPILVSLEPLYLINSQLFKERINNMLSSKSIFDLDWQILSIDEIELLQPHIASGYKMASILDELKQNIFNKVLQDLSSKTNKTFGDSFLYAKQEEIYQRINIHNIISSNIKNNQKI